MLTQLLVLRLRLLAARHNEQRQAVLALLDQDLPQNLRSRGQALLEQEDKATALLQGYTKAALQLLGQPRGSKPGHSGASEHKDSSCSPGEGP